MKNIILIILLFGINHAFSQEITKDLRPQSLKEDSYNLYNTSNISSLDLLEALEFAGIQVHKFNLGEFDKKYEFYLFADEYQQGKLVKTDTLLKYNNQYHYFLEDTKKPSFSYIDQIKIFTKTDENSSTLKIRTYALETQKEIGLSKLNNRQFFLWREYEDTNWKLGQKIPLMIFASSWFDQKYNVERFCGVVKLSEGDKRTDELLTSSPNYIVITYKVLDSE